VAVIMDGNGRWAKGRGLPRVAGHRKGVEAVRELVTACGELGIPYLTLFAFSSENWRRPETEVRLLLELFLMALDKEVKKLHTSKVRFRVIGDIGRFGPKLGARIQEAEVLTRDNQGLTLTIAANYGGRWDIAQACKKLSRTVAAGLLDPESISPESLEPHLSMAGVPELWQLAYTELYFTPALWPEFDRSQFDLALASFACRQRRFGQTGDQVEGKPAEQPARAGSSTNA